MKRPSRLDSCWRSVCSTAIGVVARLVGINENVVALRIRRPEAEHGAGREPALVHDLVEHGARIVVERARRLRRLSRRRGWPGICRSVPRSRRTASSRYSRPAPRSDNRRALRVPRKVGFGGTIGARPVELQRIGARRRQAAAAPCRPARAHAPRRCLAYSPRSSAT